MLGREDRRTFEDRGYLLLPPLFNSSEIEALLAETSRLSTLDAPQRILETDGETVRSVYWVHELSQLFGRLVRDRRMLQPATHLLQNDVYVYQTQLNPKAPLKGDVWEWHQDYLYWARDDGMPAPDALNVALFLDDVTEFNGPIFMIPCSHRHALADETKTLAEGWERTLTADLRHKVESSALGRLMDRHGIVSATGPRGSVLVFDSRLLHSSQPNLTAHPRTILLTRYSSTTNVLRPVPSPRPEWLACRNPMAVEPLDGPLVTATEERLTADQVASYHRDGFLLMEGMFEASEVDAMRRALAAERDLLGPQRVLEQDGEHVRAVYGCHHREPAYRALVRSSRLLGAARQLVGPDLYVYQFKINAKRAFGGEAWSWHQDFIVWHVVDGMPESRAVTAMVFLDDVTEFNGPVVFVPGSHVLGAGGGASGSRPISSQHVDPADFSVGPDELAALVRAHGLVSPKGPAGSVVLFHPEVIHGSATNTSPFARNLAFVTYNALANRPRPRGEPRPEHLVGRETEALEPVAGPLWSAPVEATTP